MSKHAAVSLFLPCPPPSHLSVPGLLLAQDDFELLVLPPQSSDCFTKPVYFNFLFIFNLFLDGSLGFLPRLALNSWTQVIFLPQAL
jgi:hypothetical protein